MKTEALREEVSSLLRINERCNCNEDTDQRLVLAVMVLLGVCTTLFILCIYLYFQNRNLFRRISNNEEDGGISSMVLSDKCRINSFTWLELAGRGDKCDRRQSRDTLSCINKPEKNEQRKMNFPKIYASSKPVVGTHCEQYQHPVSRQTGAAGSGSKLSVSIGMSNSVSHSSYNSANEELEFDLYDYEAKRMLCDTSETGDSLTNGNFSISELAPKKLFDSTDTVINIADDVLDDNKPAQNTFGTPVILRRGNYNSRKQIESITSDLTSSIMSELSHYSKISQDTIQDRERKDKRSNVSSLIMCFDTESINTNFGAIDDDADINTPLWTISNYDDEKMDEKSLGSENLKAFEGTKEVSKTFESHFNFPPIAQIEDLDLSDEDSF